MLSHERRNWEDFLSRLVPQLEHIEKLKLEVKRQAMIYQLGLKERAAALDGVPLDSYYYLPYDEWEKRRIELFADQDAQSKACARVARWLGLSPLVFWTRPHCDWVDFWELFKAEGLA